MRSNRYATLILLALPILGSAPAWGFNPIHESSYSLIPRGKFAATGVFSVAGIADSRIDDQVRVPFSLSLEAGQRAELGAGLKTQWGDASGNHIPYIVFGAKFLLDHATTLQGDVLLGANENSGKGFSMGFHHKEGHAERLYSRFTARLGFMDALVVDDALMAMEAAWYPTLVIIRPLSVELGLVVSSQTTSFNEYFALDLQPALQVHIGKESVVQTAAAVGLAGDRREDLRVQVTVIYGF